MSQSGTTDPICCVVCSQKFKHRQNFVKHLAIDHEIHVTLKGEQFKVWHLFWSVAYQFQAKFDELRTHENGDGSSTVHAAIRRKESQWGRAMKLISSAAAEEHCQLFPKSQYDSQACVKTLLGEILIFPLLFICFLI